jgi:hypothetical protein
MSSILLTTLFGCSVDNKESYTGKFLKGRKIVFNLSNKVSNSFYHLQVYDSLIYISDVINHRNIFVFNFQGELVENLKFNEVGPNGVGRFRGFYIHKSDSIFLVNRHAYKLYLVNKAGIIKKKYNLRKENVDVGSIAYITTGSPMFKIDTMMYLPAMPEIEPYKYDYKYKQLLIGINLQNSNVQYTLGYPEEMQKFYLHGPFAVKYCCYNFSDSILIVSYPPDNKLYTYDINKQKLAAVNIDKSQYVEQIEMPTTKPTNNSYERNLFSLQQDFFTSIYYDKYRNLYYRFIKKGLSKEEAKKHLKNPRKGVKSDRYIMVYDKEFNLLHEEKVPFLQTSREVFILPDGLYLKGNYENNENKVYFQQYIYRK